MVGMPKGRRGKKATGGGEYTGEGWKVRGPKLKLRHVGAIQTGRWMGRRANTRVPAFLMILGYPATLIIVLFSPLVVVGVGLLACLVIWHVSYRSVVRPNEHATKAKLSVAADWATRVTALVPAYLTWFLLVRWHVSSVDSGGLAGFVRRVKALFGTVFDGAWFLGYATACTLSWLLIFKAPHVVTKHNERKAAEASPFNGLADFDGTKVVSRKATRVGERYRLSVTGSGKAVSEFLDKKIKEKLAARLSLPAARIIVEPVAKNAGLLDVSVRRVDPWAVELVHPNAPEFAMTSGRGCRVTDPVVLGLEPEDGSKLVLELVTKEGAQHVVIIAGTRGGKTTLVNSILEHLTRAVPAKRDVDVTMIDITKGKDGRAWAPAVAEVYMGPENTYAALECLERNVALIASRAKLNRDAVWKVGSSPERRAKAIVLDEASALLAHPDAKIQTRARQAVSYIMGKGASELVFLIIMAQRGVLAHLGTNDVNANSFVKIMLGVAKRGEMQFVIPDWEVQGMPDMSKYGEGKKGVVLISPVAKQWSAGRTWNLSDLDTIRRIAAERVIPDAVHRAILAAEQEYARRHPDPKNDDPEVKAEEAAEAEAAETAIFDVDPGLAGTDPEALTRELPEDGTDDPDDPDNVAGAPWGTPDPDPRRGQPPAQRRRSMTPEPPRPRELTPRERAMLGWGRPSGSAGYRPPVPDPVKAVQDLADLTESAVRVVDHALNVELSRTPEESRRRWETRQLATAKVDQGETVPGEFVELVLTLIDQRGPVSRADVVTASGLQKSAVANRLRIMVNQGVLARSDAGGRGTRYGIRVPDSLEG